MLTLPLLPFQDIDTRTTLHLWDEIDKMEAVSDVDEDSDLDTGGGTLDSGSLHSAPRPSIRPFFGHTGSSEETLSLVSAFPFVSPKCMYLFEPVKP